MSTTDDVPVRPSWSISEAARRCGVSRATIGRHLAKGKFPDAVQTETSWAIPLDNLLAAGFTPDRPAPPDPAPEVLQQAEQLRATDELAQRLRAAEDALEREREARAAAEARADRVEAVDVVKDRLIAQLERQVLMLEAGSKHDASPAAVAAQPSPPTEAPPVPQHRRGLLGRTLGGLLDRGW